VEAIILVGGKGTRLRPLTIDTPKPMLTIGGVSVIEHQICKLRDEGATHIVLATSFKADIFKKAFGDGKRLGVKLSYAYESEPLGTGGAIRNAANYLNKEDEHAPVLIFNGDILSNLHIREYLDFFNSKNADIGLHLTTVENPRAFGLVPTDHDGRVQAFTEKPERDEDIITNQINAGCYIFKKSLLFDIPEDRVVSVERDTFPAALKAGLGLYGFLENSYWLDLGTPMSFVKGSIDFVRGEIRSSAYPHLGAEKIVKDSVVFADTSVVKGGSFVDEEVVLKPHTMIDGSVIMRGAHIGEGARISNSIIGTKAVIAPGSVLDSAIIGDRAWVGSENELRSGLRIWNDTTIADKSVRFSADT
jgi:mannose-1-phosphate guanylyltransferase